MVRINKFLAGCELGSRRKVEELVLNQKVTVNDILCEDLSFKINPDTDIVKVNRKIVTYNKTKIFIIINKPKGYIVTKKDEFNRKTVYDLLPEFAQALHPIGRLDHDSEGLLIMTNDGDITNRVTHPVYNIEKTYKVTVKGSMDMTKITTLRNGVVIDNYKTKPARVFLNNTTEDKSDLKISIKEGKNRQIRKMIEAVGNSVISLKRIQIGNIALDKLPIGSWRFLKDNEILYLLKQTKIKDK